MRRIRHLANVDQHRRPGSNRSHPAAGARKGYWRNSKAACRQRSLEGKPQADRLLSPCLLGPVKQIALRFHSRFAFGTINRPCFAVYPECSWRSHRDRRDYQARTLAGKRQAPWPWTAIRIAVRRDSRTVGRDSSRDLDRPDLKANNASCVSAPLALLQKKP